MTNRPRHNDTTPYLLRTLSAYERTLRRTEVHYTDLGGIVPLFQEWVAEIERELFLRSADPGWQEPVRP